MIDHTKASIRDLRLAIARPPEKDENLALYHANHAVWYAEIARKYAQMGLNFAALTLLILAVGLLISLFL